MNSSSVSRLAYSLRLRERLLIWLVAVTQPWYERWFRRRRPAWQQTDTTLLSMQAGSLGHALGCFLREQGIQLMPRFESHDVFHLLLQYDTTVANEAAMQFCLLGNGKRSLYVLGTCLLAFVMLPEYWSRFRAAYRRGKRLRTFHHWYFEYLLGESLAELRSFIEGSDLQRTMIF